MSETQTSRVELALNVSNLDDAIGSYSKLFVTAPAKVRPGTINHLGIEVGWIEEVATATARLVADGLATATTSAAPREISIPQLMGGERSSTPSMGRSQGRRGRERTGWRGGIISADHRPVVRAIRLVAQPVAPTTSAPTAPGPKAVAPVAAAPVAGVVTAVVVRPMRVGTGDQQGPHPGGARVANGAMQGGDASGGRGLRVGAGLDELGDAADWRVGSQLLDLGVPMTAAWSGSASRLR